MRRAGPIAALSAAALVVCAQGAHSRPYGGQDGGAGAAVVLRGAGYLFTATPNAGGGAFLLREEVTSPALAASLGGRSATADLTVDCRLGQSGVGDVRVFAAAAPAGEGTPMKPAAWLRSLPIDLIDLNRALCGAPAPSPPSADPPPSEPAASAPSAAPAALEPAAAPALRGPIAAEPAPPGRSVQLGAFASVALAEAEWARMAHASTALGGLHHRIEPVRRGSSQLFRLLAGPVPSRAAAEAACTAARREGFSCLVR